MQTVLFHTNTISETPESARIWFATHYHVEEIENSKHITKSMHQSFLYSDTGVSEYDSIIFSNPMEIISDN